MHGDIKTANIVLDRGVYKLCDVDEAGTGSAPYMSQARARRHPRSSQEDSFSDTYALSMCALEVLTGRQPYCELESQTVVFARVCAGQMPQLWLPLARAAYDAAIDSAIALMLASDLHEHTERGASPAQLLAEMHSLHEKARLR